MKLRLKFVLAAIVLLVIPVPALSSDVWYALRTFTAPLRSLVEFWSIDSDRELIYASIISYWFYFTTLRVMWTISARGFGVADPDNYYKWFRLWIPWRGPFRILWMPLAKWFEEVTATSRRATGRFARASEVAAHIYTPRRVMAGRMRLWSINGLQYVGLPLKSGNLLMVAQPGTHKTTQTITHLALHSKGGAPLFAIDPKGQITRVLAGPLRRRGYKVVVLDPSNQVGGNSRWNPFADAHLWMDRAEKRGSSREDAAVAFATKMVDGLIVRAGHESPFWSGAAKDFLMGLILWMLVSLPKSEQTLGKLYQLATEGLWEQAQGTKRTGLEVLLWEMGECRAFGGAIASSVSGVTAGSEQTTGSVLYTMREQLQWLKRPGLKSISSASDFSLAELRDDKFALFITATLSDLNEFPGWFRLLTVLALGTLEDTVEKKSQICLMACDEFAHLGTVDSIQKASGYMRSFRVRLLLVIQDIGQISNGLYANWETFFNGIVWWMGTQHTATLAYLEKTLGMGTVKTLVDGPPEWMIFSKRPRRYDYRERQVMTADQIKRFLAGNNMIVTWASRPFKLKPVPYFKVLPIRMYDPDPEFGESWLRSFSRAMMGSGKIIAGYLEPLGKKIEKLLDSTAGYQLATGTVAYFAAAFAIGGFTEEVTGFEWLFFRALGIAAGVMALVAALLFFGVPLYAAYQRVNEKRGGPPMEERPYDWQIIAWAAAVAVPALFLSGVGFGMLTVVESPVDGANNALQAFLAERYFYSLTLVGGALLRGVWYLVSFILMLYSTILFFAAMALASGPVLYYLGIAVITVMLAMMQGLIYGVGKLVVGRPEHWFTRFAIRWLGLDPAAASSPASRPPKSGAGR